MDRKRIIGVCITKIHDTTRADLMHRLHHLAMKKNYKLLIFNSFIDFYNNDAFDKGAASVYDIINFDLIDALIIHTESFCNKSLIDKIIVNAKEHNTPVILLDRTCDGCFSIVGDYEAAFKTVINHIIKDHGVKDLFFIGGKKENDPFTESRIRCYKEVLLENGVDFKWFAIGKGELKDKIEEKISRYGLQEKFILLGEKSNPYPYIKNCDIYVQPSNYEGKSIAIDEAKAFAKPIVATKFTTVFDQLSDGETALLAEINAQSVAEKITQLINDESLCKKLSDTLARTHKGNEEELEKFYKLLER